MCRRRKPCHVRWGTYYITFPYKRCVSTYFNFPEPYFCLKISFGAGYTCLASCDNSYKIKTLQKVVRNRILNLTKTLNSLCETVSRINKLIYVTYLLLRCAYKWSIYKHVYTLWSRSYVIRYGADQFPALVTRQSAVLSCVTQHVMSREFVEVS